MSSLKIEIDEDQFDKLLVKRMQEHAAILKQEVDRLRHPEDIMQAVQTHAALLQVIQYWMAHTDFDEYLENNYGSKSNQGES